MFGTNRPNQRRDPHNFTPTVKYILDGLTEAKVWPDDAGTTHTHEPEFTNEIRPDRYRIIISGRSLMAKKLTGEQQVGFRMDPDLHLRLQQAANERGDLGEPARLRCSTRAGRLIPADEIPDDP